MEREYQRPEETLQQPTMQTSLPQSEPNALPVVATSRPPVTAVQNQISSNTLECDVLTHWKMFKAAKKFALRNKHTINRYDNLGVLLEKFKMDKNIALTFGNLDQELFSVLVGYMIKEPPPLLC